MVMKAAVDDYLIRGGQTGLSAYESYRRLHRQPKPFEVRDDVSGLTDNAPAHLSHHPDTFPATLLTHPSPGSSMVIQTAPSISCYPGHTESKTSEPWPENDAYVSSFSLGCST